MAAKKAPGAPGFDALAALKQAQDGLLLRSDGPFWLSVLSLKRHYDPSFPHRMATDGARLIVGPSFEALCNGAAHRPGLTKEAMTGVAHELLHCLLGHLGEMRLLFGTPAHAGQPAEPGRGAALFPGIPEALLHILVQTAHEAACNNALLAMGMTMPTPEQGGYVVELPPLLQALGLPNPTPGEATMPYLQRCAQVQLPPQPPTGGWGKPGTACCQPASDATAEAGAEDGSEPATAGAIDKAWGDAMERAITTARAMGSIPQGALLAFKLPERIQRPPDWRRAMAPFVTAVAHGAGEDVRDWRRPDTRAFSPGILRSRYRPERVGTIAILQDTSGSCLDDQGRFYRVVDEIVRQTRPMKVIVAFADADVYPGPVYHDPRPGFMERLDPVGGGGTDFRPGLRWAETIGAQAVVYLTDLYGTFPEAPPRIPVLWAATTDMAVPFGTAVRLRWMQE